MTGPTYVVDLLAKLPLFATDREIALAVVGRERAVMWVKAVIPQLVRKGFPRIDPLHDGRPVPLVRKFYQGCWGIAAGFQAIKQPLPAIRPKNTRRSMA